MLHRAECGATVVFTGGVAKDQAMTHLLQGKLEITVLVPPVPDIAGALAAARYALEGIGGLP